MNAQEEILRIRLQMLIDDEKTISSEKILKISKELDKIVVNDLLVQTKDQLRKKNDCKR